MSPPPAATHSSIAAWNAGRQSIAGRSPTIGTAPYLETYNTHGSGRYGGNMDCPDVRPGATRELAAGCGIAVDARGHFIESQPEYVVEKESRSLQRRKSLKCHQQRERNVLHFLGLRFDRFGQPGAAVRFPLTASRLQDIKAKARYHPAEKCLRLANLPAVSVVPAEECVLDDIFRVGH